VAQRVLVWAIVAWQSHFEVLLTDQMQVSMRPQIGYA
jgi:hypothetical protein